MAYECGKAIARRLHEPGFLQRYFVGEGIDIGGGYDGLDNYVRLFPRITKVRNWDLPDGDAQEMAGVPEAAFDFVHSSHCLEHMRDPIVAMANWWRILKPGGHLIVLVPDEDLYEQGVWPSTFNTDHKRTFTIWKRQSWSPVSTNVTDLLEMLGDDAKVLKLALLDTTFLYELPRCDQTATPLGECAIEFVVQKVPRPKLVK